MTAEEYIVEQIQRKDSVIAIRDDEIRYLKACIDQLRRELKDVLDLFEHSGEVFDASIWLKYDEESYKLLEELINKYNDQ